MRQRRSAARHSPAGRTSPGPWSSIGPFRTVDCPAFNLGGLALAGRLQSSSAWGCCRSNGPRIGARRWWREGVAWRHRLERRGSTCGYLSPWTRERARMSSSWGCEAKRRFGSSSSSLSSHMGTRIRVARGCGGAFACRSISDDSVRGRCPLLWHRHGESVGNDGALVEGGREGAGVESSSEIGWALTDLLPVFLF